MRSLLFTVASLLVAGSASASSIEIVKANEDLDSKSIQTLSCAECPPIVVEKRITYVVPVIEKGTERIELKEIDGQTKSFRTEAWLGGSPVVFVNKLSEEAVKAAKAEMLEDDKRTAAIDSRSPVVALDKQPVVIDGSAKTGALSADVTGSPVTVRDNVSQEVDLGNAQLRLD